MFKNKKPIISLLFLSFLTICSCNNSSSLEYLDFASTLDLLDTYNYKEQYFLSTFTFKFDYTLYENEEKIEGIYELDYDKDSYYLYAFSKSDDGVKQRLIYKNDNNQYVEYIHGKNITSTENYIDKMNEVRNIIKKYALYELELVNNEGNTYVFNKKDSTLELNLADDYIKILNNGLISKIKINNEDGTYIDASITYGLSLNRRKAL